MSTDTPSKTPQVSGTAPSMMKRIPNTPSEGLMLSPEEAQAAIESACNRSLRQVQEVRQHIAAPNEIPPVCKWCSAAPRFQREGAEASCPNEECPVPGVPMPIDVWCRLMGDENADKLAAAQSRIAELEAASAVAQSKDAEMHAHVAELEKERDRLLAALTKHGRHVPVLHTDRIERPCVKIKWGGPCDCGLDAAIGGA